MRPISVLSALAATVVSSAAALAQTSKQPLDSATVAGFRWRTVGPANFEGRVADVVGIPSPSKTFFVAAAGGGIWKTTNAGTTFRPVFDDYPVISMGALAIAPSDTQQVWAGTGEQNSRNTIEPGQGIYKSTDGGLTWKLMGLEKTQHIGRIVVHPTNPNVVYVAALGAAWKSNPERGLYKTEDGGQTWKLIKFVSDKAGFIDVGLDPKNPNVVWASSYERVRGPYFLKSGGPGSALWKSTDAGATWSEIKGGGFPETEKGRISFSIYPQDPNIVYAMVEADSIRGRKAAPGTPKQKLANGLYRTKDGGKTWEKMNDGDTRPFYYSQVRVHPRNPDRVWFSSTSVLVSNDGGKTARLATQGIHVDHHAMWIDPNDPDHFIVGDDGGISMTWDGGGAYDFAATLPIGQFYSVSFDFETPYNVCAGAQDNGSWCGPSRRKQGPVTNAYWFTYSGGDGFWTAQHPDRAANHLRRVAGWQHPALGPEERDDDVAREAVVAPALCDLRGLDPHAARRYDAGSAQGRSGPHHTVPLASEGRLGRPRPALQLGDAVLPVAAQRGRGVHRRQPRAQVDAARRQPVSDLARPVQEADGQDRYEHEQDRRHHTRRHGCRDVRHGRRSRGIVRAAGLPRRGHG